MRSTAGRSPDCGGPDAVRLGAPFSKASSRLARSTSRRPTSPRSGGVASSRPLPQRGTGALPRSRVEPEPEQNPDGIHLADHPAVQHSVYLAAFWPQKGQSAIEMVGGELPGWMPARDDGTVAVSRDLEVVRQTLCADIDAERFAKEVYPRYVLASLSNAATPQYRPAAQHPTTYIICEQDQASLPQAQEAMSSAADHVIRLPSSHSPFLSMPKQLARALGAAVSSA